MSKQTKNWHERNADKNKFILVDTNNRVIVHCTDLEDAKGYANNFPVYRHVRIYKEVET